MTQSSVSRADLYMQPPMQPPLLATDARSRLFGSKDRGETSTPRSRRPALERIGHSLPELLPPPPPTNTSLSDRLQDVEIQYLGDPDHDCSRQVVHEFGSSSGKGQLDDGERVHASLRLSVPLESVTVTLPTQMPVSKAPRKRKVPARAPKPKPSFSSRVARIPLQGASLRKQKVVSRKPASRKKLRVDNLPESQESPVQPLLSNPPRPALVPAMVKKKMDFQDPSNPLP